jgi:hypothetical protein
MVTTSDTLLKKASPASFNLLNTKTDKTSSDAAEASCRNYKDIDGLRKLQKDQMNRTYFQPGCGWRYKPSSGINPEINQAAFGNAQGPLNNGVGSPDEVAGGTQWMWDLNQAEKTITANICQSASKCSQLSLLGRYADVCGYCKTSGAVIPVVKSASGTVFTARYPQDPSLRCATTDIVTATTGACPPPPPSDDPRVAAALRQTGRMGFKDYKTHQTRPMGLPPNGRGDLTEAFEVRGRSKEGFINLSLDDIDQCSEPPLSRDCVVLAARMAGCSDEGTLISALNGTPAGADYDSVLNKNTAYTSYKSIASPGITAATLKDGSVSLSTALDDFGNLMRNTQSSNPKTATSARDLCIRKGEFEKYDFCAEMQGVSIIGPSNIQCVQQAWLNNGGTQQGSGYPTLNSWSGKTYQQFVDFMNSVKGNINSQTKATNAGGLTQLIGTQSDLGSAAKSPLPKNENTRGVENVWFDFGDIYNPVPVILRCDLRLSKDRSINNGETVPWFVDWVMLKNKFGFTSSDNKGFTSAFEVRSDSTQNMILWCGTDDGFMFGINQNPFEGTQHKRYDWGSWAYQGPTGYQSPRIPIHAEKSGKTNTVVMKWFNGYGQAQAVPYILIPGQTNWTPMPNAELYVTQEPLAPWMQFEVCTRPNNGRGNADGFFEKRFNGPSCYNPGNGQAIPSFDVNSSSLAIQTDSKNRVGIPMRKAYISFTSSSWWHTLSYIHVNAVKTITLLIRPTATLAVGASAPVFYHTNLKNFVAGCDIYNRNGQYSLTYGGNAYGNTLINTTANITPNEWNLLVIQYIGDSNGLRRISFNVETLEKLRDNTVRGQFGAALRSAQNVTGAVLIGANGTRAQESAGWFMLGAATADFYKKPGMRSWGAPGFTGDVAWIHGFRNFLDTDDLLKSEINQTWISRWPRGNLDSDAQTQASSDCVFDPFEYNNYFGDLNNAFNNDMNALKHHYIHHGINEGRTPCGAVNPSCKFESNQYYALNPDVKAAGMNAKTHYVTYGINEGRKICGPK